MVGRGKDDHDVHGNPFPLLRSSIPEHNQRVHRGDFVHGSGLLKFHEKAKFQHILDEELGSEQVKARFRIVDWIGADPVEVMKYNNVVACVHHGGANSYHEVARQVSSVCNVGSLVRVADGISYRTSIPQIVLAQWFDQRDM